MFYVLLLLLCRSPAFAPAAVMVEGIRWRKSKSEDFPRRMRREKNAAVKKSLAFRAYVINCGLWPVNGGWKIFRWRQYGSPGRSEYCTEGSLFT